MACSPTKAYALISAAIAALGAAIALALIFFNPPALAAAIALVLTVTLVLIPAINAELRAYAACRGASTRCPIAPSIDTLGQAATVIGVVSLVAALALQIAALGLLGSFFASWAAAVPIAVAEGLKWGGVAGLGAGIGILVGVMTKLASYVSCRDEEDRATQPAPGASGGALTLPATEGRLVATCVELVGWKTDVSGIGAVRGRNPDGTHWRLAVTDLTILVEQGREVILEPRPTRQLRLSVKAGKNGTSRLWHESAADDASPLLVLPRCVAVANQGDEARP